MPPWSLDVQTASRDRGKEIACRSEAEDMNPLSSLPVNSSLIRRTGKPCVY